MIRILILLFLFTPTASAEWTEATNEKLNNLTTIGMPKDIATSLITNCKNLAIDPAHCIKIGASILGAESSLGKRCHRNNCVGMNDWAVGYKSKDEWIRAWVAKYTKYWYKQENPSWFYRNDWTKPATHYCLWKRKDWVCPEGFKNSWKTFNSLTW